jgi:hypothetical protein
VLAAAAAAAKEAAAAAAKEAAAAAAANSPLPGTSPQMGTTASKWDFIRQAEPTTTRDVVNYMQLLPEKNKNHTRPHNDR